jgi:hypothetical protein
LAIIRLTSAQSEQNILFLRDTGEEERGITMRITIPNRELKEELEDTLGVKVTKQLLEEFIGYLKVDLSQWINDNRKSFVTKLAEEKRI